MGQSERNGAFSNFEVDHAQADFGVIRSRYAELRPTAWVHEVGLSSNHTPSCPVGKRVRRDDGGYRHRPSDASVTAISPEGLWCHRRLFS